LVFLLVCSEKDNNHQQLYSADVKVAQEESAAECFAQSIPFVQMETHERTTFFKPAHQVEKLAWPQQD
jgi:hypothetical protein